MHNEKVGMWETNQVIAREVMRHKGLLQNLVWDDICDDLKCNSDVISINKLKFIAYHCLFNTKANVPITMTRPIIRALPPFVPNNNNSNNNEITVIEINNSSMQHSNKEKQNKNTQKKQQIQQQQQQHCEQKSVEKTKNDSNDCIDTVNVAPKLFEGNIHTFVTQFVIKI